MQRVLVMGCSGAGKSTFGRRLADKPRLPLARRPATQFLARAEAA